MFVQKTLPSSPQTDSFFKCVHTRLQCFQLDFWCISEQFSSDVCYSLSEIVFVYAV